MSNLFLALATSRVAGCTLPDFTMVGGRRRFASNIKSSISSSGTSQSGSCYQSTTIPTYGMWGWASDMMGSMGGDFRMTYEFDVWTGGGGGCRSASFPEWPM